MRGSPPTRGPSFSFVPANTALCYHGNNRVQRRRRGWEALVKVLPGGRGDVRRGRKRRRFPLCLRGEPLVIKKGGQKKKPRDGHITGLLHPLNGWKKPSSGSSTNLIASLGCKCSDIDHNLRIVTQLLHHKWP